MKHNALILSILLALGMGNVVYAQPSEPVPQTQQLYEEHKGEIYQEIDDKLNKKIKTYMEPFQITFDLFKYFYGILITVLGTVLTINFFKTRSEVKNEIREVIGKATTNLTKTLNEKTEAAKEDIHNKLNEKLKEGISWIGSSISLEQTKRQLLLVVEDIESPSIHHTVTTQVENEIKNYLSKIHKQKKDLERFSNIMESKDIADTPYNNEIAGKAHHYLGEHDKAIPRLKEALKLNFYNPESCQGIYLCLGNSYSGLGDYIEAINSYNKIHDCPIKHSGIGHAYKGLLQFNETSKEFNEIKESDGEYYWESLYEQANSFVSLGEYDKALKKYNDSLKLYNNLSKRNEIKKFKNIDTWIYVGLGDCYWKDGNYQEAKKPYEEALKHTKQIKDQGTIHYKLGRLQIDMNMDKKNFFEAANHFVKIDSMDEGEYDIFQIFKGYVYINENRDKDGNELIDQAVTSLRKKVKEAELKMKNFLNENLDKTKEQYNYILCYPYYNLSVGLAMKNETTGEAKEYLRKLIVCYNFEFVKKWATKANCSDFIAIRNDPAFRGLVGYSG